MQEHETEEEVVSGMLGRSNGYGPRSPALLACAPYELVLADARSLAFLAFTPPALVLADARSLALLASAPFALVLTHAYRSLMLFLTLVCLSGSPTADSPTCVSMRADSE